MPGRVELFEPGGEGPEGASGVALGVEEVGASAAVRQRWQEALGTAGSGPVTRKTVPGDRGCAAMSATAGPVLIAAHFLSRGAVSWHIICIVSAAGQ